MTTSQNTSPNTPQSASSIVQGRVAVSPSELDALVSVEIDRRVAKGESFTAYAITQAVRDANPNLDLPHADVRRSVRMYVRLPGGPVGSGAYVGGPVQTASGQAWQYSPAPPAAALPDLSNDPSGAPAIDPIV